MTQAAPIRPVQVLVVMGGFPDVLKLTREEARRRPLGFSAKLSSAVVGPGAPIVVPEGCLPVLAEVELGLVVGGICRRVSVDEAANLIAGFVCVNDVTMLEQGFRDLDFVRAKSLEGFCPLGPALVEDLELDRIAAGLDMRTLLNGVVMQKGNTAAYTYSPAETLSQASQYFTLATGDVISMGSPQGAVPIEAGATVTVEIDGVGAVTNPVVAGSRLEF